MNLDHMYIDRMSVYRMEETETEWGETTVSRRIVYEDAPCRLDSKNQTIVDGDVVKSVGTYTVFCYCLSDIVAGDEIIVTTNYGQEYKIYASNPFKYPSHQEISCTSEKDV